MTYLNAIAPYLTSLPSYFHLSAVWSSTISFFKYTGSSFKYLIISVCQSTDLNGISVRLLKFIDSEFNEIKFEWSLWSLWQHGINDIWYSLNVNKSFIEFSNKGYAPGQNP